MTQCEVFWAVTPPSSRSTHSAVSDWCSCLSLRDHCLTLNPSSHASYLHNIAFIFQNCIFIARQWWEGYPCDCSGCRRCLPLGFALPVSAVLGEGRQDAEPVTQNWIATFSVQPCTCLKEYYTTSKRFPLSDHHYNGTLKFMTMAQQLSHFLSPLHMGRRCLKLQMKSWAEIFFSTDYHTYLRNYLPRCSKFE